MTYRPAGGRSRRVLEPHRRPRATARAPNWRRSCTATTARCSPTAGRRFLDAPSPAGYLDEWTARLAAPNDERGRGRSSSVLVFRLGDEWLALPVGVLVEVTRPRPATACRTAAGCSRAWSTSAASCTSASTSICLLGIDRGRHRDQRGTRHGCS